MSEDELRKGQLQFALVIAVAAVVATAGLVSSHAVSERYDMGALLVALLVAAILIAFTSVAWSAGPICGVAFGWFAFVPVIDLIYPRYDQGPPPVSVLAWSWVVAGLIVLALLRAPWAAWRRRPAA